MDQSVTLTIDGREVAVPPGITVVEAARLAGIEIPTLCNQEKLHPAGLCRLCLVEIEKMRGLQAACATVVRQDMVVHTDTELVQHNRRMVLELLCTNHPLDCPVCDAAGDCRLQDYVFKYGRGESRFVEEKRHKGKAMRLGPAVVLDQERCVLCQRCVRFCEEVLDEKLLGVFQRGARSRISTLDGSGFDSPFSGNVVDLCPVGAMTDRAFRFKGRTWELKRYDSTCALCPVGCRLTAEAREGRILRMRGREAPEVNNGWLCDVGRQGFAYADSPERLRRPLVRKGGELVPATWDEALQAMAAGLKGVLEAAGPHAVAAVGSPRLSNEAAYLLSKFVRAAVGTNNVDSRLGTAIPAPAQATPAELRRAGAIVLFEGDPSEEAPIVELWIKEAVNHGGKLYVVHPRGLRLGRYATLTLQPRPGSDAVLLGGLLAKFGQDAGEYGPTQVASLTGCTAEAVTALADALTGAERAVIVYGAGVADEATMGLLVALAKASGARLLGWSSGANARGAADLGLRPDRLPGHAVLDDAVARGACKRVWGAAAPREAGLAATELWPALQQGRVRALYVVGADPLCEAPDPQAVRQALDAAEFVVVQDAFLTATAAEADVVLPAAAYGEEDGSATNLAGQVGWQAAPMAPLGEARPHWRIVAEVARALGALGCWSYDGA
ncbi:MAG TPA: NADH-quinone oxidoreductase subunit NuoG, partial [Anaerolineae bacterium]|nr:NADH-quinone oxidoreductase subunit NuoG [Anaerolineae bacterium]